MTHVTKGGEDALRDRHAIVVYDCASGGFIYPAAFRACFGANFDGRPLWQMLEDDGFASAEAAACIRNHIEGICTSGGAKACFEELVLKNAEGRPVRYSVGFVCAMPGTQVSITFAEIGEVTQEKDDLSERPSEQDIASSARKAQEEKQFEVYYQPRRFISARSGSCSRTS